MRLSLIHDSKPPRDISKISEIIARETGVIFRDVAANDQREQGGRETEGMGGSEVSLRCTPRSLPEGQRMGEKQYWIRKRTSETYACVLGGGWGVVTGESRIKLQERHREEWNIL